MTSAWREPPGQGDRAEGQDSGPAENQLEMFDAVPHASGEMLLPSQAELIYDSALNEDGGRRHVVVTDMSAGTKIGS